MSELRTRVRGFTTWVNMRLKPYDQTITNVLEDIATGTCLKKLVLSLTGHEMARFESMDGLSEQQKITRVQWAAEQLQKRGLLPKSFKVNAKKCVQHSADDVFGLLWHLVSHDIWLLWKRIKFLRHEDDGVLLEAPFIWIASPEPQLTRQTRNSRMVRSLRTRNGVIQVVKPSGDESHVSFPHTGVLTKFYAESTSLPPVEYCMLTMMKDQLGTVSEGRKLQLKGLSELATGPVICALINSFVPGTLPTELLLNDRWTINTALRTAEKIFRLPVSSFDSEDLMEADEMAVCAYFCTFFMLAYQYCQSATVARKVTSLRNSLRESKISLEELRIIGHEEESSEVCRVRLEMDAKERELEHVAALFDVDNCLAWSRHVQTCIAELHQAFRRKIAQQFDVMTISRNITVRDLCHTTPVDLSLTRGHGYYLAEYRESIADGRRAIIWDSRSGTFIWQKRSVIERVLGVDGRNQEFVPTDLPRYQVYVEVTSKKKLLKPGNQYLYRVLPGNWKGWAKTLRQCAHDNDVDAVDRITRPFQMDNRLVNEADATGDCPLHVAARRGHYEVVLCLLERGADMDRVNSAGETALYGACRAGHLRTAHLLIEWGCDVHVTTLRGHTALEHAKTPELRDQLLQLYGHYSDSMQRIADGDVDTLERIISDHVTGGRSLSCVRSRCVNGSTILHAAVYFGRVGLARRILAVPGMDLNVVDYRAASVLHRAREADTVRYLLDAGAAVNTVDKQLNTPLHVKAYGEVGQSSDVDAVRLLLEAGASLVAENERRLTPVHCAAMQGRVDVIEVLLSFDVEQIMVSKLNSDTDPKPPSPVYLAVANDYIECTRWLLGRHFCFKPGEQDRLLLRVLTGQLPVSNRPETVEMLLTNGADARGEVEGATLLHYVASRADIEPRIIERLLDYGADAEAVNARGETAIFAACRHDLKLSVALLIRRGASIDATSDLGLTPFDLVRDLEEWILSGLFDEITVSHLRTSALVRAGDLVRRISTKVRGHAEGKKHTVASSSSNPSELFVRRIEELIASDAARNSTSTTRRTVKLPTV